MIVEQTPGPDLRRQMEQRASREHRKLTWLVVALALVPLCLLSFALYENVLAARQFDAVDESASLGYRALWIYGVTQNAAMAHRPPASPAPITPAPSAPPTL